MILSFSTHFKDGTPTFFISKIWESLLKEQIIGLWSHLYFMDDYESFFGKKWNIQKGDIIPKPHTIRKDVHDRWHAGRLIHSVVFNRSKNQFQFAPAFPCVSTQKIEIKYDAEETRPEIYIDGREIDTDEHKQLAVNDGFKSEWEFYAWFSKDFIGKIIHWTSLKY